MRTKKGKFVLNPETFQYRAARYDAKLLKHRILIVSLLSIVIAGFGLYFIEQKLGDLQIIYLEWAWQQKVAKNDQLLAKYKELEKRLGTIHDNDNGYYRSLLSLTPLDADVWEGGTGGSAKYTKLLPEVRPIAILSDKLLYRTKLQHNSFSTIEKLAPEKSNELSHIPAIKPLNTRTSSGFGYRNDPFFGAGFFHTGIDFDSHIGDKIYATGDGKVITSGITETGYGIQVEINHGYGFVTKYAHMSKSLVKVGQAISRGQLIGLVGSTGWSTGPHLHYEVIKNGVKINPEDYYYSKQR
ncbi:MAG: M23 family metallopeptidase [Bacteroidia bacterium]|nr:M23 family metallopeptidase [Bacteroidia bacterium]